MPKPIPNTSIFSKEAIDNILSLGETLQKIHQRLLSEGIDVFAYTTEELKEIMCYDEPREPLELYVLPKDETTK